MIQDQNSEFRIRIQNSEMQLRIKGFSSIFNLLRRLGAAFTVHSLYMIGATGSVRGKKEFEPNSLAPESEPLLGPQALT